MRYARPGLRRRDDRRYDYPSANGTFQAVLEYDAAGLEYDAAGLIVDCPGIAVRFA